MEVVASWFYGIVHDAFLEHLIRSVRNQRSRWTTGMLGRLMGVKKKERSAHMVKR
jgi:hypothetical protein